MTVARARADRVISAPRARAEMNAGAEKASGEVLLFLHATLPYPDHVVLQGMGLGRAWGRRRQRSRPQPAAARGQAGCEPALADDRHRHGDQAIFATREAFPASGLSDDRADGDIALSSGNSSDSGRCACASAPASGRTGRSTGCSARGSDVAPAARLCFGADPPSSPANADMSATIEPVESRSSPRPDPGLCQDRLIPALGEPAPRRCRRPHRARRRGRRHRHRAGDAVGGPCAPSALRLAVRGASLASRARRSRRPLRRRSPRERPALVIGTDCPV